MPTQFPIPPGALCASDAAEHSPARAGTCVRRCGTVFRRKCRFFIPGFGSRDFRLRENPRHTTNPDRARLVLLPEHQTIRASDCTNHLMRVRALGLGQIMHPTHFLTPLLASLSLLWSGGPDTPLSTSATSTHAIAPSNATSSQRVPTARLTRTLGSNPQSTEVRCSAQDATGDLWFGTTGEGIYRYDGKGFIQYTTQDGLPSNIVWSALADKQGRLWFGTDAGLCRWNGERMDALDIPARKGTTHTSQPIVWTLHEDSRGTIWICTGEGLYFCKDTEIRALLEDPTIANPSNVQLKLIDAMIEDREGNLWFASGMSPGFEGLCRFDGAKIEQFNPGGERWIRTIVEDADGILWMGTRTRGVWRYDGHEFTAFSDKSGTGSPMLIDHAGNIWFDGEEDNNGFNKSGIWRYNGKTFDNFELGSGLGGYGVWCISEDRDHNIWVGTRNTGLYRFDGKSLISLSE